MQDKFQISIPSGKLKGRKITLLSSKTTRSTKAVVAESLFNTLRQDLQNMVFAELFGGSSFMAIYAISEGAKSAFVFENDKKSFEILQQNIKNLDLKDKICANFGDSFILSPKILQNQNNLTLYIDPPFNIRDGFDNIYEKCFKLACQIDAQMVVFEHISTAKMPEKIKNLTLKKSKKFGNTTLSYFTNDIN